VRTEFPILTLITNIAGAVIIGFVVGVAGSKNELSENATLFWKTGVCGGFTTFSTFSLEAINLLESRQYWIGGVYMALSLGCCLTGVIIGRRLASMI
jgi:CrcB protein